MSSPGTRSAHRTRPSLVPMHGQALLSVLASVGLATTATVGCLELHRWHLHWEHSQRLQRLALQGLHQRLEQGPVEGASGMPSEGAGVGVRCTAAQAAVPLESRLQAWICRAQWTDAQGRLRWFDLVGMDAGLPRAY